VEAVTQIARGDEGPRSKGTGPFLRQVGGRGSEPVKTLPTGSWVVLDDKLIVEVCWHLPAPDRLRSVCHRM